MDKEQFEYKQSFLSDLIDSASQLVKVLEQANRCDNAKDFTSDMEEAHRLAAEVLNDVAELRGE